MRNALRLEGNLIVTTDNSGGIGEKAQDVVSVPDALTAHYSARVALLEQWAAHGTPFAVLIHNFSGAESWERYVKGVTSLLEEAQLEHLPISGSTETNITLLQSAVSVTMIGTQHKYTELVDGQWFTYGAPLVGQEVIAQAHEVASIRQLKKALEKGLIERLWPVGSKGILYEMRQLFGERELEVTSPLDLHTTAGPSTVVLVYISKDRIEEAQVFFGEMLRAVIFK